MHVPPNASFSSKFQSGMIKRTKSSDMLSKLSICSDARSSNIANANTNMFIETPHMHSALINFSYSAIKRPLLVYSGRLSKVNMTFIVIFVRLKTTYE
tara:strand:+ start:351 stop:644 length:294 start_codon:yes stop_codon:yes gene_type:complete